MKIDYRELKQQIRIIDLLRSKGWKATKGRGAQLRGPCPLSNCDSRSYDHSSPKQPSFSLHLERNIYQCFRCQSSGTVLDFWQNYRAIPLKQAVIELQQMLNSSNRNSN